MMCFHSVKKAISTVFLSADEVETDTAEITWKKTQFKTLLA